MVWGNVVTWLLILEKSNEKINSIWRLADNLRWVSV